MKTSRKECELNELCNFLLVHVAGSDGVRRIERTEGKQRNILFSEHDDLGTCHLCGVDHGKSLRPVEAQVVD